MRDEALGELARHLGVAACDVISVEHERVVHVSGEDAPLLAEAVRTRQPASGSIATPAGRRIGVVVPILGDAKLVLIRLVLPEAGGSVSHAADLAASVAALLAVVIDRDHADGLHARRTAELEVISLHDELTGLLNRRGFHAVAEGQLALARRNGLPGLVLFLDLDGLKSTNDQVGHAAGDVLLCDAARALRTTFRGADTIGRVGGDEFVVFSIASSEPHLAAIIARLAEEVSKINLGRDQAWPLAWSIGFLGFDAANGSTLSDLLAEADRRMYEAKQRGRQ